MIVALRQSSHSARTSPIAVVCALCGLVGDPCPACLQRPPSVVCLRRSRPHPHPKGTPRARSGTAPAKACKRRQAGQRERALRARGGRHPRGTPPQSRRVPQWFLPRTPYPSPLQAQPKGPLRGPEHPVVQAGRQRARNHSSTDRNHGSRWHAAREEQRHAAVCAGLADRGHRWLAWAMTPATGGSTPWAKAARWGIGCAGCAGSTH